MLLRNLPRFIKLGEGAGIFILFNDFLVQKVDFSRLMRVYVGLIMLACVPSLGLLASYWSAGFGTFSSGSGPCFPLAGGLCKFYANIALEEIDQYSANQS
jgi:hypothetical protein